MVSAYLFLTECSWCDVVASHKGVRVVSDGPFLTVVTWWHVLKECALCVT